MFNGVEVRRIGRQEQDSMSSSLCECMNLCLGVKCRIVQDEGRARTKLRKKVLGEPGCEPLCSGCAGEEDRSKEFFSSFACNQARTGSCVAAALSVEPCPSGVAVRGGCKAGFIQIDQIGTTPCCKQLSEHLQVGDASFMAPLPVAKGLFLRVIRRCWQA